MVKLIAAHWTGLFHLMGCDRQGQPARPPARAHHLQSRCPHVNGRYPRHRARHLPSGLHRWQGSLLPAHRAHPGAWRFLTDGAPAGVNCPRERAECEVWPPGLATAGLAAAWPRGRGQGLRGEAAWTGSGFRQQVRQLPGVSLPLFPHPPSGDLQHPPGVTVRTR